MVFCRNFWISGDYQEQIGSGRLEFLWLRWQRLRPCPRQGVWRGCHHGVWHRSFQAASDCPPNNLIVKITGRLVWCGHRRHVVTQATFAISPHAPLAPSGLSGIYQSLLPWSTQKADRGMRNFRGRHCPTMSVKSPETFGCLEEKS